MLQNISIKNFRGFDKLEINDIKKLIYWLVKIIAEKQAYLKP